MRAYVVLFVLGTTVAVTGCTHLQLEKSTINQASTIADLQYRQVLDNLAMFTCNKNALPWHAKLKDGSVQVTDQGQLGLAAEFGHAADGLVRTFMPGLSAQRGLVETWGFEPSVDTDDLELLQLAYGRAVNPQDGSIRDNILKSITELCVRFDILPSEETLVAIIQSKNKLNANNKLENEIVNTLQAKIKAVCDEIEEARKLLIAPTRCSNKDELDIEEEIKKQRAKLDTVTDPKDMEVIEKKIIALYDKAPATSAKHRFLKKKIADLTMELYFLEDVQSHVMGYASAPTQASVTDSQRKPLRTFGVARGAATMSATSTSAASASASAVASFDANELVLYALRLTIDDSFTTPGGQREKTQRNIGLIAQAEDKIKKLQELRTSTKFNSPWLHSGSKHEVPKCACYVGHYKHCDCDCYIWVMPEQYETLRDFTLTILSLAPTEKQEMFPRSSGPVYSPTLR